LALLIVSPSPWRRVSRSVPSMIARQAHADRAAWLTQQQLRDLVAGRQIGEEWAYVRPDSWSLK